MMSEATQATIQIDLLSSIMIQQSALNQLFDNNGQIERKPLLPKIQITEVVDKNHFTCDSLP